MSISNIERTAVQWLLPFLSSSPIILDVGSNKGTWSDIIMEESGDKATFHFFEPNAIMLNYTRIKYDYNKNIIYNEQAISDKIAESDFYYFENENNGLSSVLYNDAWKSLPMKKTTVDCITVDAYCKMNGIDHIDFLKIDVEGNDYNALKGAMGTDIEFIQIEYGAHWKLIDATLTKLIELVKPHDYKVYSFNGTNFQLIDITEDYRAENFIITRRNIINLSQGWNKVFIENTANTPKIEFILEIGSCEGLTARYICENMLTDQGRMICVDPLEDYYIKPNDMPEMVDQYYRWVRNTRGLPVNLYRKKMADAFEELKDFLFDFIYVDGDHSPESVYNDGKMALTLCKRGGHILFDDYEWGECSKGIDKFMNEFRPHYELVFKNYQVMIKKI